jgi:hypothetical protein
MKTNIFKLALINKQPAKTTNKINSCNIMSIYLCNCNFNFEMILRKNEIETISRKINTKYSEEENKSTNNSFTRT